MNTLTLYRMTCRWPWSRSYTAKLLAVGIAGIHVPLVGTVAYLLVAGNVPASEVAGLVAVILSATLVATAATLAAGVVLLAPLRATARALRDYAASGAVPCLPVRLTDEAGLLMADVQSVLARLDAALDSTTGQRAEALLRHRRACGPRSEPERDHRPTSHVVGIAELLSAEMLAPRGDRAYRNAGTGGAGLLDVLDAVLRQDAADARPFRVERHAVDLHAEIARAVSLLHADVEFAGVRLDVSVRPAGALLVRSDPRILRQILFHALQVALAEGERTTELRILADQVSGVAYVVVDADVPWRADDLTPGRPGGGGRSESRASAVALGLALIRSLTEAVGGELGVRGGNAARRQLVVRLPLQQVTSTAVPAADRSAAGRSVPNGPGFRVDPGGGACMT